VWPVGGSRLFQLPGLTHRGCESLLGGNCSSVVEILSGNCSSVVEILSGNCSSVVEILSLKVTLRVV
jgi:hypothetical protein